MADKVNLHKKIEQYRQAYPKLKSLPDDKILSIMLQNGAITLTEEEKRSLFINKKAHNNNIGLEIEKSSQRQNNEKTIYLQSGRKVVYEKLSNGKVAMKYFGADGTPIKPNYFKKIEGQISISADGGSYTLTKNGKKQHFKAKDSVKGAIDQNIAKLNNQEKVLKNVKNEQGWIGKGWDWFKNKTGIGDGSDKAQQRINAERNLLRQMKTGKISKKDFKEITGYEYSQENLKNFRNGDLSPATAKINGYKEGQDMATEVVADIVSGVAAVGIYSLAIAAAPVTGGGSLALGFAAAATTGALVKTGVKAVDTVCTNKKYTLKDLGHDCATGAFSGALGPLTAGMGGAVGKTVATKFGVQAIKQVGKEIAEEGVNTGIKATLKTALTNPAGYEYVGGTFAKRAGAMATEMATDGALSGAFDNMFRTAIDGGNTGEIVEAGLEGAVGGVIMSPIIGGGFKVAGKGGSELIKLHEGYGYNYKTFLGRKFQFKLNKDDIKKIQFIKHDSKTPNLNPTNLTNELKRIRYYGLKVKEMMANNPNLSPIVGKLPQKWGKTVASKEGLQKIDNIFYGMSQKFYVGKLMTTDVANAEKELAQILKTPVKIEKLGSGMVGFTFKMTIDGQKYVLKCFKDITNSHLKYNHGNYNELAGAVYASKHDPKHFAKFYFGRFGENNDGYMVTKFIEKANGSDAYKFSFREYTKQMDSSDKGHNVIGSKIIDYGAAYNETVLANFSYKEKKILKILSKALDDNNVALVKEISIKYANSNDFKNPINYIKALVYTKGFTHSDKNLTVEYFMQRKECFDILGLEILPPINYLGKSIVENSEEGRLSMRHYTYFNDAGKYYGLTKKEWVKLFGNYGTGNN